MGKIVVSQNVSLDGVVEDPTGEEGSRQGGWFEQFMGQDREAWAAVELSEASRAEALLLGRRTDEYFGPRWSSAPVFPVVLGAGERLFAESSDKTPLRLIDTEPIGDGLAYLTYERARAA